MPDRWVLVIAASYWQIPLIETVRRLGFKALAIDRNPDAPGAKIADKFAPVDITDGESTINLAKMMKVSGVVSDQTDLSVPTLAKVTSALGLPGPSPEVAFNTTNKARMRELAKKAGLKNPRFRVFSSVDNAKNAIDEDHEDAPGGVGLPCVVKPTDSQASRGVQKIEYRKDLVPAVEEAFQFSREGRILVEEYIKGTEVTVEGCRYAGVTHLLGVSAKRHTPPPHIIAMNLDFPAPFPVETHEKIHETYNKLVDALGIVAGSVHGELIVSSDGIYLVEMANRGGGSGTSSHVVPAISGVDLLEANVWYSVGDERPVQRTMDRASVLRFMVFPPGKVREILGLEKAQQIPGVVRTDLYIKPGDTLVPPVMDTQRHGYIITVSEALEEAQKVADEVEKAISIVYE
ncbi:MAG: ATP-grasp domain-containing protein [bacterium]|nr:ATP-grasp domain-containing protein [bacterium]